MFELLFMIPFTDLAVHYKFQDKIETVKLLPFSQLGQSHSTISSSPADLHSVL